jgi:alkanesulfonate monooxygenase SsuD/methylene tetrahydromethanopterin reductase-like flavin-dependent oxidoreductase (luciferase family)
MTDHSSPSFGLWYDFRNPPQWQRPFSYLYEATLQQIEIAEQLGFGSVWLSEHHFSHEGHMSSPLVYAAAVGQRTRSMTIGTNLIVSPLHDPVRLAEDSATLSLLTDGRFRLGIGQGYSVAEFSAFGKNIKHRPSLLEECVAVLRRAWSGSSEAIQGKRYSLPGVAITPVPEKIPELLIGSMTAASAERAARLGDGVLTMSNAHQPAYLEALDLIGKPREQGRIFAGQWAVIAEDPERVWADVGKYALHQMNDYISMGAFGPPDVTPRFQTADQILAVGPWVLWDADQAVDALSELVQDRPQIQDIHFWPQLPGEPVDDGTERLRYVAENVLPRVRARIENQRSARVET